MLYWMMLMTITAKPRRPIRKATTPEHPPGVLRMLQQPHRLHGALLAIELGVRPPLVAAQLKVSQRSLAIALDLARQGKSPKAPYNHGVDA